MCRDVAQQGKNIGRWKEITKQADCPDFSFFLNLLRNFPNGTCSEVGCGLQISDYLLRNFPRNHRLATIFLYFSLNKDLKRCNHKNWHLQLRWDVVYRNTARSLKSVQNFDNFFLYFNDIFGNFDENKQGKAKVVKQSVVERG
jgi:hypothetical protein